MEGVSSILPSSAQSTSGSATAQQSLNKNFDLFLSLLTTQLQNQDPLDPTDTSEMTAQLVQFSSVEQTIATNSKLEELIALTQSQSSGRAVVYIGKTVEALASAQKLEDGGTANWRYSLAEDASEVVLTIADSKGAAVYSETLTAKAGTHDFAWNGKTSDGDDAAGGTYFLTLQAKDAAGEPVQTDTRISGIPTEVDFTTNPPVLIVNSIPVSLSDVTSVKSNGA